MASAFLPVEGYVHKTEDRSFFHEDKSWVQRYIRIEDGELAWWERKEDASSGDPPEGDVRVPLARYRIEDLPATGNGEYFPFCITLEGEAAAATCTLRSRYEFRVHSSEDRASWIMQFKAHGCRDANEDRSMQDIHKTALAAAVPQALMEHVRSVYGSATDSAADASAAPGTHGGVGGGAKEPGETLEALRSRAEAAEARAAILQDTISKLEAARAEIETPADEASMEGQLQRAQKEAIQAQTRVMVLEGELARTQHALREALQKHKRDTAEAKAETPMGK